MGNIGVSVRSSSALPVLLFIMSGESVPLKEHHRHENQVSPSMREGPRCVYAKYGSLFTDPEDEKYPDETPEDHQFRMQVESARWKLAEDDDERPEDKNFRKQVESARRVPGGIDPRGPDGVVEEDANGRLVTRCLAKKKCFVSWIPTFDPVTNKTFNRVAFSGCLGMKMMRSPLLDGPSSSCQESRCINMFTPRVNGFCCCSGDLCNAVFEDVEVLATAAEVEHEGNDPNPTPAMICEICALWIPALMSIVVPIFVFVRNSREIRALFDAN